MILNVKDRESVKNNGGDKHTFVVRRSKSVELTIAKTGARYTNEGPCTSGSLVPKDVCRRVVIPETKSTVETTVEASSCNG